MKLLSLLALGLLMACGGRSGSDAVTTRLADLYKPEMVEGASSGPVPALPRTEIRFDAPAPADNKNATRPWKAGPGVAGLAVRDGRLEGQTTDEIAIVDLVRETQRE